MNWTWGKLLACLCFLQPVLCAGVITDWFWGSEEKTQELPTSEHQVRDGVIMPDVPFETASSDERFLQEAQFFGLALTSQQLESCQQKVVLRLRASCSSLTEEQLAKLSVALLNCQSATEGRPQYPCSDDMSLRECTGDMDPDTWNTYHLMSNRARAVCLATRQAQFRALTEMTVNKLMHSAQGQLNAMSSLQEGQERLGSLTEGTLRSVTDGQRSLLLQQDNLLAAQRNAHNFVAHSLRDLYREKAMVAAGHRELARVTQSIREKLDKAGEEMQIQNSEQKEQHKHLLTDLEAIQDQAGKIWSDIDKSTHEILSRHELAVQQYENTLESLQAINASVLYLQTILESTRKEVDERLGWISDTLGGASGQLDLVVACLMHIGFLLMAMLTTAFLGAPACTRVLLLVLVALNVIQLVRQGPDAALTLPATSFVLVLGTALHQLVHALHRLLAPFPQAAGSIAPPPRANGAASPVKRDSSPLLSSVKRTAGGIWHQTRQFFGLRENSLQPVPVPSSTRAAPAACDENQSESSGESDSGLEEPARLPQSLYNRMRRAHGGDEGSVSREASPSVTHGSRSGTPSRGSSTPRLQCGATCVNGTSCRLPVTATGGLCFRHSRQSSKTPRH